MDLFGPPPDSEWTAQDIGTIYTSGELVISDSGSARDALLLKLAKPGQYRVHLVRSPEDDSIEQCYLVPVGRSQMLPLPPQLFCQNFVIDSGLLAITNATDFFEESLRPL